MKIWPLAGLVLLASPARAQSGQLQPLLDTRTRWEEVDQAGTARTADAVTARIRSGFLAQTGAFQVLVESEATLAILEHYNSGSNGRAAYPLIIDPQNVELNRAQLRYAAHGLTATAGRQLLELEDQRFVGSASFRQNEQTFDATRVQYGDPRHLFADVTYAWSARTVNGIDGSGVRPQAISGDNVFAVVGTSTPAGLLTGFAYLVDQDEFAVQSFKLSSQTYGVRLTGSQPLGSGIKLAYAASWARQSDWHRNPNHYAANYWLAEGSGSAGALTITAGHEVLGADDGRALTSVQTPLASLFKFQGWADKFTTTPPNGIRDLYGSAALAWKAVGSLSAAGVSATYHRFRSDCLDQHYGSEWDFVATVKRGRTGVAARFAHYQAQAFATDTDKLWLEASWSL
jgi:hypothetical protein